MNSHTFFTTFYKKITKVELGKNKKQRKWLLIRDLFLFRSVKQIKSYFLIIFYNFNLTSIWFFLFYFHFYFFQMSNSFYLLLFFPIFNEIAGWFELLLSNMKCKSLVRCTTAPINHKFSKTNFFSFCCFIGFFPT